MLVGTGCTVTLPLLCTLGWLLVESLLLASLAALGLDGMVQHLLNLPRKWDQDAVNPHLDQVPLQVTVASRTSSILTPWGVWWCTQAAGERIISLLQAGGDTTERLAGILSGFLCFLLELLRAFLPENIQYHTNSTRNTNNNNNIIMWCLRRHHNLTIFLSFLWLFYFIFIHDTIALHYILGGLPECLEFLIEATGEVSVALLLSWRQ